MDWFRDVRFAARLLVKDRWFTLMAVVVLALGIGANNAVFTIVNAVLLRGLPLPNPNQIMFVGTRDTQGRDQGVSLRDCFQVIVAAEDVAVGKPDPSGYLLTLKLLSEKTKKTLAPADCLVVEDAPTVIRSVKSVGFPTLGVATSYPLMKLSDADWAVKTLRPDEVLAEVPRLKLDV